jgi:hypothetical protein
LEGIDEDVIKEGLQAEMEFFKTKKGENEEKIEIDDDDGDYKNDKIKKRSNLSDITVKPKNVKVKMIKDKKTDLRSRKKSNDYEQLEDFDLLATTDDEEEMKK